MNGLEALFKIKELYNTYDKNVLANESADLSNQRAILENARYGQATPLELEKLRGNNTEQEYKNKITRETMDSSIGSTNSSNQLKIDQNKTKQSIARNDMLIEAYSMGGKPELIRKAKELNVSPEFFNSVINAPDVGRALTQNRMELMGRLAITPEYITKELEEQRKESYTKDQDERKHKYRLEEIEAQGKNQIEVADIYAAQRAAAQTKETAPTSDKVFAALQQKLANGETLTTSEWQAMENIARLKAASGQQKTIISPEGKLIPQGQAGDIIPKPQQNQGKTKSGNTFKIERQ